MRGGSRNGSAARPTVAPSTTRAVPGSGRPSRPAYSPAPPFENGISATRALLLIGEKGPHAYLDPLNIYRGSLNDLRGDCSKIVHLSDGPLSLPTVRKQLLGRVVGLFIGPREFADRLREEAELETLLRKKQERDRGAVL